jgi:hypothetical protein
VSCAVFLFMSTTISLVGQMYSVMSQKKSRFSAKCIIAKRPMASYHWTTLLLQTESRSIFAELSPGPMTCTQRHWLRIHYRIQ